MVVLWNVNEMKMKRMRGRRELSEDGV